MSKLHTLWLAGWLGWTSLALAANSTPWITVGKYQVHPTRILAKYAKGTGVYSTESLSLLSQEGLVITHEYKLVPGLVVLDVPRSPFSKQSVPSVDKAVLKQNLLSRIADLRHSGLFAYVQPSYVHYPLLAPNDSRFVDGTLWGLHNIGINGGVVGADIDAERAWDITTGSTNVIVAVVDTGIRYTHKDLAAQMWHDPGEIPGNGIDDNKDGYVDDVYGVNILGNNGDPMDYDDHGTHVAGTIGAAANNGYPSVGVTWHVQLMAVRWLTELGGVTDDAIKGIDYAVAHNAKILNNSWGGGPFEPALFDAINRALQKGVLFVAAAGNSGLDNDTIPFYPAGYQLANIVSVAALDRANRLADFSDYGATTVDLGAPGVDIFSTLSGSDTDYGFMSGTSMATPHVTGVAALILAEYPNASLTELRDRLLDTTAPVVALQGKTVTGGRVDAYNALHAQPTGILSISVQPPSGSVLLGGSSNTLFVQVSDLFPVTNATVTASGVGLTNATFLDDGNAPDAVAGDGTYSGDVVVPQNLTNWEVTFVATATNKVAATNVVDYAILPPPPNDLFANASKLPTLPLQTGGLVDRVVSNNKFATMEPGEPLHAGDPTVDKSLWWNWSSSIDTNVIVDTAGSDFDTVLAVYTGDQVDNLTEVASVDDVGKIRQGYVSFDAQPGVTYHIAVAGSDAAQSGTIRLRVQLGGQPDTNGPVVAIISPPSGLVVSSNQVRIEGTAFDPEPNASGVDGVFVNVNNQTAGQKLLGTTNWQGVAFLDQGTNLVQISAVDVSGNFSKPVTINVTYHPPGPVNDLFANATVLTETTGEVNTSNSRATKEFGEPDLAGNMGGKSLWWRWTAPADGVLLLSTTNSDFDTLLGLDTGDRLDRLVSVAANDDAYPGSGYSKIQHAVRANQTYDITVDGYNGTSGTIDLQYAFTPAKVVHLTVNATTGGAVLPGSDDYEAGSTLVLTAQPNPYYDFLQWGGGVSSIMNPLSLTLSSNLTISAQFVPHPYFADFENGQLSQPPWSTSGGAGWEIETNVVFAGKYALRSGPIGDSQRSVLSLTANLLKGTGSFAFKVSSEEGFDYLSFYLNGQLQQRWSGEAGWAVYQFSTLAGTNTLEWRYAKDATGSAGQDAAFLDNVDLPVFVAKGASTPALLSLQQLPDGTLHLIVTGQTNQIYQIQASTNLMDWETIGSNIATHGYIRFSDPDSGAQAARFYRAVSP